MSDYFLKITRVSNGYTLETVDEVVSEDEKHDLTYQTVTEVIQDDEEDELKSGEGLLYAIMEYFSLRGSRHDKERLTVVREKGDKYEGND